MKKKNIIIIIGIIVLVLIIGAILMISGVIKLPKSANKERELTSLTKEFYSYYYDEVAKSNDIKKFLKGYKDSGLKVNLGSIENYVSSHRGEEVDYSIFDKCDVDKTYATMTPHSPYGKNDITIELEFSCQE